MAFLVGTRGNTFEVAAVTSERWSLDAHASELTSWLKLPDKRPMVVASCREEARGSGLNLGNGKWSVPCGGELPN